MGDLRGFGTDASQHTQVVLLKVTEGPYVMCEDNGYQVEGRDGDQIPLHIREDDISVHRGWVTVENLVGFRLPG